MKYIKNFSDQIVALNNDNEISVSLVNKYIKDNNCSEITTLKSFDSIIKNTPVIIYDTEFTAWEGSAARNWSAEGEYKEIIQIGAVCIDFNNWNISKKLNLIIKPQINCILSDYIVNLTGINQSRIDSEGITFNQAIIKLHEFSNFGKYPLMSYGKDYSVILENAELLSHALPSTFSLFNIAPVFSELGVDITSCCSGMLSEYSGITPEGNIHDALYDATSIATSLHVLKSARHSNNVSARAA